MTETLTYDPTPADAPEFNEAEQQALEAADKLGQEEAELYAGKFQNAEELENAYLELQKKLGSSDGENLDDDEVEDTTLDEAKLDAFNDIIDRGNSTSIQIAVAGLRAEYEAQEGYEGRMLTGKAAKTTDAFRSQAEVVAAMSDPRYDRDPAYRQDLYDKLERSNVAF